MAHNTPLDLQIAIMQRLPVKSLLQFRTVSKEWKSCIDCYNFQKKYGVRKADYFSIILRYHQALSSYILALDNNLNNSPIQSVVNNTDLLPVGTSQGIWCFSYGRPSICCIVWNPSIKRSINVLVPIFNNQPDNNKILMGFGVRPDTLDPTIIKISYPKYGQGNWVVSVFSLTSMEWKYLERECFPRESIRFKRSSQVVVGRLLIWVGHERFVNAYDGVVSKENLLVAFDLIEQRFHIIHIEVVFKAGLTLPVCLSNIGNCLILSGNRYENDSWLFSAWSLFVDVTAITSFNLFFHIQTPNAVRLLGFTDDEIPVPIVEVAGNDHQANLVQVYELSSHSFQNLLNGGVPGSFFIGPYKESLILLPYPDRNLYH